MDVSIDFQDVTPDQLEASISRFSWLNPPLNYSINPGKGLLIVPKPKTDFWRKTFQDPPSDRCSGHTLLYPIPSSTRSWECSTEFSLSPVIQYDQAGLMVFVDETHWIKAGIEFENGFPQMSCVVTNDQSDWSYLTFPTAKDIKIRICAQQYESGVCECKVEYEQDGVWTFLRESPLLIRSGASVGIGPMCCAPKKEDDVGMDATFRYFKLKS